MPLLPQLCIFCVSIAFVSFGADFLVRGSASIAAAHGIKKIVIGLTIVAFGTSAPELVVSLAAVVRENPACDISIGNVIGSNIANIALILGIAWLIKPVKIDKRVAVLDIPLVLLVSVVFIVLYKIGNCLSLIDGIILLLLFAGYLTICFKTAKEKDLEIPEDAGRQSTLKSLTFIVLSIVLLAAGGHFIITSGTGIATILGISPIVIGIFAIAVGTSIPELATSVVALVKGEESISVGNILGSNIFNILLILGVAAVAISISNNMALSAGMTKELVTGFAVMMVAAVMLYPFMLIGKSKTAFRIKGVMLLAMYSAYILYLFRDKL